LWKAACEASFLRTKSVAEEHGDIETLARLNGISSSKAGAFLTTIPCQSEFRLSDREFVISVRTRFGLNPLTDQPDYCPACQEDLSLNMCHLLDCHASAGTRTRRHDDIVLALMRWIRRIGGYARREPRNLDPNPESEKRPDLIVFVGSRRYLVDVVVVHSSAPSHRVLGASGKLKVADRAADIKRGKYNDMAAAQGMELIPFAVETYGGFSKDASAFIQGIIKSVKHDHRVVSTEELYGIRPAIAIAIQRGNAACFFAEEH
jgi:hypothetical protein